MSLCDVLTLALQEECGFTKTKAANLVSEIIEWGGKNGHSGTEYYWPSRYRELTAAERDEAIRKEFVGGNLKYICEKYGVTSRTVYRAIHS